MDARRAADEAEIRRRIDGLVEGLRARDLESLEGLYTADVVSFDVEPPLQHFGVDAKLKNWAKVFAVFGEVTYEFRELTFAVGDDVAFGHGFGRLGGTLGTGEAVKGTWVRVTFGFRRIDGVWVIAHDQVSVPVDMATGMGVAGLEP
ncbi:nuclear transport factor 2 family protein [Spirillospora sp. NPDC052242]